MDHRLGIGRVQPGTVFYAVGVCCVIAGGLIAAITAPLDVYKGSWLAAYVVLVCGVAQAILGRAQELIPVRAVSLSIWAAQFAGWNLGNALVIVGTMVAMPWIVDAGGFLLLGVVISAMWGLRGGVTSRWGQVYGVVLLVLAVSIPVGLVLSHLRN